MSFTTVNFMIFFGVLFLLYFWAPERYQRYILLIASYFFYAFTSVKALFMLLAVTLITFTSGLAIEKINSVEAAYLESNQLEKDAKKQYKAASQKKRTRVVTLCVVALLLLLGVFKYTNFVLENTDRILGHFGMSFGFNHLNILLPVGLSFYIFQSMGYIIDVYRGMVTAESDISKYALYVAYFPQVLQGPIGDYSKLSPQLYAHHKFDRQAAVCGIQRVVWGFFKKLVIANSIAIGVNRVFDNYYQYSGIIWILVLGLYSIELYADFSGYMDIAIGCSQMLGITLDENFSSPYFAKSIAEFWRRWHITLGVWFKNYMFYPLLRTDWLNNMRKKYKKQKKTYMSATLPNVFALLITWFCIGLWHGAATSYIAYGLFHGFFVIMDSVLSPVYSSWREKHSKTSESKWFNWFRVCRTFAIVTFGYGIFVPANLEVTGYIYRNMFAGIEKSTLGAFLYNNYYYLIAAFLGFIVMFLVDLWHEKNPEIGSLRAYISSKSSVCRYSIYVLAIVLVLFLGTYGDASLQSFAYFQF